MDVKQAIEEATKEVLAMAIPYTGRDTKHEDDFGDQDTVGIYLKRRGKSFQEYASNPNKEWDFGIFQGKLPNGKFGIAALSIHAPTPQVMLEFDSMEQIHREWIID